LATYQSRTPAARPITFVSHLSPTNITGYIHRLCETNEYMVMFIDTNELV
jgi:hypothetical protein